MMAWFYLFLKVMCQASLIVRDHISRNKIPSEFLYDSKGGGGGSAGQRYKIHDPRENTTREG